MHFLIEESGQELYNEDSYCSEGTSNAGADNMATGPKLNAQLTAEEFNATFKQGGGLKQEVIDNATVCVPGSKLGDKNIINQLTADGSSINDWAKMESQGFKSPQGNFKFHFYQNVKTGEVSYAGFKMKMDGSNTSIMINSNGTVIK